MWSLTLVIKPVSWLWGASICWPIAIWQLCHVFKDVDWLALIAFDTSASHCWQYQWRLSKSSLTTKASSGIQWHLLQYHKVQHSSTVTIVALATFQDFSYLSCRAFTSTLHWYLLHRYLLLNFVYPQALNGFFWPLFLYLGVFLILIYIVFTQELFEWVEVHRRI